MQLLFDTNLNLQGGVRPPLSRPGELVRDLRLLARVGERWGVVYQAKGNGMRRHMAHFERVETAALRLEVTATWGDASARVYEVWVCDE